MNSMRKSVAFFLMAVLLPVLLASCTVSEDLPQTPVLIIDQLGRTVTLETAHPQRIVSLAPSHTETLYALGLGDRLVAVTDYCNYPPEAAEKPSIGGFSTPNIEEVVAMDPDLILATSIHEAEVIAQFEAKGFTVVATDPTTIDEVIESITLIGKVTGAGEAAASLIAAMQSRVKVVTDKTGTLAEEEKPHVLYIVWHDPLMSAGAGTLQDELIRTAGGINVAGDLDKYTTISLEVVIAANPQVIIAGSGHGSGGEMTFEYIQTDARLKDTDARQNDRVFSINSDLASRPTPRIVEALEQFVRFIHPGLFE